jgi:hypothetical protein
MKKIKKSSVKKVARTKKSNRINRKNSAISSKVFSYFMKKIADI